MYDPAAVLLFWAEHMQVHLFTLQIVTLSASCTFIFKLKH